MAGETLICDTSFVGHLRRRVRTPARYGHWDAATIDRLESASLAISVVTIAETRVGYRLAEWGPSRIETTEQELQRYVPIPVRRHDANEWARLRIAAQTGGVAISDNDLWVAATASRREEVLVTCDQDHVRIAEEMSGEVLYLAPPV
jgi:predicted nucleic acid-binding protein